MSPLRRIILAGLLSLPASWGHAATLSGNGLTVGINDSNGAINSYILGEEFFRLGTFVSDYGFQLGTSWWSFSRATAYGGIDNTNMTVTSVTATPASVQVLGSFYDFAFSRIYSIDAVEPVLSIQTTLTNLGTASATIRSYETVDPDQGADFATMNDVVTVDGKTVAQSTDGRSAVIGTPSGGIVSAGGFGLGINWGGELNAAFDSPNDPDGVDSDEGLVNAIEHTLGSGESVTFGTYFAAGESAAEALASYSAVTNPVLPGGASAVPLPASLFFALGGLGALAGLRRRRRVVS